MLDFLIAFSLVGESSKARYDVLWDSQSTPLRPGRDFTSYVTRYGCACVRIAVTRDGCACEKGFGFSVYGLVITVLMIFLMEKWSFISIIFVQ